MAEDLKNDEISESRLTPRQERFCEEYLIDLNGTQAAKRAGYSEKTAQEQSSRLLSNVIIQAKVQELADIRSKRVSVSADSVLREFLRIAMVDLKDAYDDEGHLLPINEMPEDVRRAISGIEVEQKVIRFCDEEQIENERTYKVKFWDKTKALESLGRHLKLFTDKHELSGPDGKPIEHITKIPDDQLDAKIQSYLAKSEVKNEPEN